MKGKLVRGANLVGVFTVEVRKILEVESGITILISCELVLNSLFLSWNHLF